MRFADGFEQAVVLHVAGADLQHVGVFGDEVDVFGGDDFGDDRQAGFVAGRGQQLEAFFLEPLEAVGAGARLERAAAEGGGAGLLDRAGRADDLLFALDGAGPAMTPRWPPPTVRLPARTTVGSDFISRLASLYGARTGSTSSTPGPLSRMPTRRRCARRRWRR